MNATTPNPNRNDRARNGRADVPTAADYRDTAWKLLVQAEHAKSQDTMLKLLELAQQYGVLADHHEHIPRAR
jgi:hypothetical protein